jgi:hypothetical protein
MHCTECHGSHGLPSACTDCHDPTTGPGAAEHLRHPSVNCTGCHDQGSLSIWQEGDIGSKHFGEYITRRFAHTLTSWPSHNLTKEVICQKCHHRSPTPRWCSMDVVHLFSAKFSHRRSPGHNAVKGRYAYT